MTEYIEIETTYRVDADFQLPDLRDQAIGGIEARAHRLTATYFDTEDLRLAARRITLYRRTGDTDAGWRLKLPWGAEDSREFHAPLGTHTRRVPSRLVRLAASAGRGAALCPVARIRTDRTEHTLLREDKKTPAMVVADDRITGQVLVGAKDAAVPLSWRQISVEPVNGSRELLSRVLGRLAAGARPRGAASQLLYLLGDRVPAPARRPEGTSAGDVVLGYLWDQIERLLNYDPRVRLAEDDAIHQMRVTTRRIQAVLQVFPSVLDPQRVHPITEALGRLASILSTSRDLEVLRHRFAGRIAVLPPQIAGVLVTDSWLDLLDEQQRRAHSQTFRELSSERYFALLGTLDELRSSPPLHMRAREEAAPVLGDDLARALRRLEEEHEHAQSAQDTESRVLAWHAVRKATKRARYAAELAESVLGEPAGRIRSWAGRLQEVLGDNQDGVAALGYLQTYGRRLVRAAPKEHNSTLVTLGALVGIEQVTGQALIEEAERVWKGGPELRITAGEP